MDDTEIFWLIHFASNSSLFKTVDRSQQCPQRYIYFTCMTYLKAVFRIYTVLITVASGSLLTNMPSALKYAWHFFKQVSWLLWRSENKTASKTHWETPSIVHVLSYQLPAKARSICGNSHWIFSEWYKCVHAWGREGRREARCVGMYPMQINSLLIKDFAIHSLSGYGNTS